MVGGFGSQGDHVVGSRDEYHAIWKVDCVGVHNLKLLENAQVDGWIEMKWKKGKKGLAGSVCIAPSLKGGGVPGEVDQTFSSLPIVKWEFPHKGWYKANFDGASKCNLRVSGAGIVIRDWNENIVMMAAQRLEWGTNNEMKAQVALLVVQWGIKLSVQNLHLEGDSQIIINTIIKGETNAWFLNISKIRNDLNVFRHYKVSHVRRISNEVVDLLSKWVTSFEVHKTHIEGFSNLQEEDVAEDVQGDH
ncbi:uncharacterized protein LOC131875697 [Cryptomeria japonica]|uniref:uncharacterized protein LOC131875697 n=1 Tax=Cryptomeria japonica TaxID=3369 RepID=UPI0027D9F390|nr:uncharacterized protein LOC131875697 [Cryptomeria japonica]